MPPSPPSSPRSPWARLPRRRKDANGNPIEVAVQDLGAKGVEFRVCLFTLKSRNINKTALIDDVAYVPSGVR